MVRVSQKKNGFTLCNPFELKRYEGTANFGRLRDPSFLAARMGAVTYRFDF